MNIFKLMNIINMQQLKVEHENTTAKKDKGREKGRSSPYPVEYTV